MTAQTTHDDRPANAMVEAFMDRFVNRKQPYAVQQEDGTYRWRYESLTPADVLAHLRGELTLALSSSDGASLCRWLCLDVDAPDGLRQLLVLNKALQQLGLPGLVEASRRGGHLWLFLDASMAVVAARTRILAVLDHLGAQGVTAPACELYPDVGTAAHAGLDHAVRLPLGIHRLSGRRYALFDEYGLPCVFTTTEAALRFVTAWPSVLTKGLDRLMAIQTPRPDVSPMSDTPTSVVTQTRATQDSANVGTRSAVIRWVDAEVSPLDLLAEFAPDAGLRRRGQGYLGWYPFHNDRAVDSQGRPGTPSFYVVFNAHYGWSWRCLSTNCAQHEGPMRHPFRLLQDLTGLDTRATMRLALERWPQLATTALTKEALTHVDTTN